MQRHSYQRSVSMTSRTTIATTTDNEEDADSFSASGGDSENLTEMADDEASLGDPDTIFAVDDVGQKPMFLQLTCSSICKGDVGRPIHPVSVDTLPTCLGNCNHA